MILWRERWCVGVCLRRRRVCGCLVDAAVDRFVLFGLAGFFLRARTSEAAD